MKKITIDEFIKFDYIDELNKEILSSVVDGKLSDEALLNLYNDKKRLFSMYGFFYSDVSKIDLSGISAEVFNKIAFSTYTKFPDKTKLPKFFDAKKLIQKSKQDCFRFKVDDKNCTIAIIDNPTQFYLHDEFKDINYEIIDYSDKNDKAHFHTEGVLSNICSKNLGYGQKAKYLVYVVNWESPETRQESHLKALQDIYSRIENGEKVSVVSISNILIDRALAETETASKNNEMVEKLYNNSYCRCVVVDSTVFHKNGFQPVYCNMLDEVNKNNFKYSYDKNTMLFGVPINKIEPLFGSTNGYAIKTNSMSSSWAIPIFSYFYAVCRQHGDISLEEYINICKSNCIENDNQVKITDFESVVEKVQVKQMLLGER